MTPEQAAAYIAAFIDGEGHISCTATGRFRATKAIAFSNTDKQLFDRVVEIAKTIGFEFRTYYCKPQREGWSDKWVAYLAGGKPAFEKFAMTVPIQCERKRKTLSDLLHSYIDPDAIRAKQRTSVRIPCPTCGEMFSAFPADLKRGQGKYCSFACSCIARRKKIEKHCAHCGSPYLVAPSRSAKTRFCSHACVGASQAARLRSIAQSAARTRWAQPD